MVALLIRSKDLVGFSNQKKVFLSMLKDGKEKSNDNTAFKTCPVPLISMKISRSDEETAL